MTKKAAYGMLSHAAFFDFADGAPLSPESSSGCFALPYFTLFRIAAFSLQIRFSYAF